AARVDAAGDLVLLADQDRRLWDHEAIGEAAELVEATLRRRRPGPYQLQAAIAVLHGLAPSFTETDWPQIAELYQALESHQPTAVVRVNRAVAEAEVHGPATGLELLDELASATSLAGADQIDRWHLHWSTRADLLRRLGRLTEAAESYERALTCPTNDSDQRFLLRRLDELHAEPRSH
ncbi:MAG TPA: DUF6596 domain-containing protein, partial [Jiangellaceae bacterium]|nr:DUF6596 domain-containing protein [Jiangellaceae bacterium]